ncbi:MAG: hypothetical protein QF454_05880 [Candidatus Thalassarchaeaceae archaeon]|nr:hypothetical protein [Candidatus Thalassarchaeaceae archaeon]
MRRVGIVGDGLTGLVASLAATSNGAEVALFGKSEPLGGLASPIHPEAEWLFDRAPIFWRKKGHLDQLLRRMKVPIPQRRMHLHRMATIRDKKRYTLPEFKGVLRRPTGYFASDWLSMVQSAKTGDLEELDGPIRDAATLLSLLWDLNPKPNSEAVTNLAWKGHGIVTVDGWIGVSGRLITACYQSDVTFHLDGPVTGFRRNQTGQIDGIKRKGRILPVDVVIRASSRKKEKFVGRYLGLSGKYLRPHMVLWDADNSVLLVDLGTLTPERIPEEFRGKATLLHCIAFGDPNSAAKRIEDVLDAQCSGWRGSIEEDFTLENLRLPKAPLKDYDDDMFHAHLDNAFSIGQRAAQS